MKLPTKIITASVLVLASTASLAQTSAAPTDASKAAASQPAPPALVSSAEFTRPAPAASGPSLRLRLGAGVRPLLGYSLVGQHRAIDGSWLVLDAVPGLQLSERFAVELGVNAMFPFMDRWDLAKFRLALTPAVHSDIGPLYLRAGVPVMVSDTVRLGVQGAAGVTISKRVYVGIVGDVMVHDLLASIGLELGVRFDPLPLSRGR